MSKIKKRKNISGQYIGEPKYKKGDKVVTTLTGNDVLTISEGTFHNGLSYMYYFEESEMGCGQDYISLAPIKLTPNTDNELKCTGGDWKASLMCGVVTTIGMTDIILPDTEEDKNLMAASKDLYKALDLYITRIKEAFTSPVESNKNRVLRNEMNGALYQIALKALQKANPNYK